MEGLLRHLRLLSLPIERDIRLFREVTSRSDVWCRSGDNNQEREGPNISVMTFGAVRVGGEAFRCAYESSVPSSIRIVCKGDKFPLVPDTFTQTSRALIIDDSQSDITGNMYTVEDEDNEQCPINPVTSFTEEACDSDEVIYRQLSPKRRLQRKSGRHLVTQP